MYTFMMREYVCDQRGVDGLGSLHDGRSFLHAGRIGDQVGVRRVGFLNQRLMNEVIWVFLLLEREGPYSDENESQTQIIITMSKLNTLEDLLVQEIKDLFNAEGQLVKALPKMAKSASQPALKNAFLAHLKETQVHVERLENVAEILGASPRGKTCKAMKGLIEEGAETIDENGDALIKDLALIVAAQKVEHYEIAGYGSAKALAAALGHDDVVALLQETENEEGKADKDLTSIAKQIVARAPSAAHA